MRKKILALAISLASSCLNANALANPFVDVVQDHWAYDAVAQLARDGIIDGYGDGTYRGDQNITRYEMAQMVARALLKKEALPKSDKSIIDRLAKEFSKELNTLGVRITKLEEKADNIKFSGFLRYDYVKTSKEDLSENGEYQKIADTNRYRLRLLPEATVNQHWKVKGQIQYDDKTAAKTGTSLGSAILNQAYVQGKYANITLNLGRIPYTDMVTHALVFDDAFSGMSITTGKAFKTQIAAGRIRDMNILMPETTANYQSIEFFTDSEEELNLGLGYHHITSDYGNLINGADTVSILTGGVRLPLLKNLYLTTGYAKDLKADSALKNEFRSSYNLELQYKKVNKNEVGSYEIFTAYRQLGILSTINSGYNIGNAGEKFFTIGTAYTFLPNAQIFLEYLKGKDTFHDDADFDTTFARLNVSF